MDICYRKNPAMRNYRQFYKFFKLTYTVMYFILSFSNICFIHHPLPLKKQLLFPSVLVFLKTCQQVLTSDSCSCSISSLNPTSQHHGHSQLYEIHPKHLRTQAGQYFIPPWEVRRKRSYQQFSQKSPNPVAFAYKHTLCQSKQMETATSNE